MNDNEDPDNKLIQFPGRKAQEKEKLINLPPVTKGFIALLIGIQIILSVLDENTRNQIYAQLGFIAARYSGAHAFSWEALTSPFSYALIHGGWIHVLMNTAMLMAFGAGLERWMGGRRMIIFFILCALAALIPQFLIDPASQATVIGASGGLSGFFAAILILMKESGQTRGRFGLWPAALIWIVISVAFGVTGSPDGNVIAWPAHLGGFIAGFIFFKPVMRFIA